MSWKECRSRLILTIGIWVGIVCHSSIAFGQPTFSVDFQGPVSGPPGPPFIEGSVLTPLPPGVFPPPAIVIPAPVLGIVPGPAGFAELDALSYGVEPRLFPNAIYAWSFSVDEFAVGFPAIPFPSVTTEGAFGALEASADVYTSLLPPGPLPPVPGFNVGLFDGNGGLTPFAAPGLNLVEPNPPIPGVPFDPGDNLDAWDIDAPPGFPVYFSLDAAFPDPIEGPPANSGTAAANGFSSADVLVTLAPFGPPGLYAPAPLLGLDALGPGTDDLDALILNDLTDGLPGVYTPTAGPYSWLFAGTDMLLFSVRRGSALVGVVDPILGLPISEGDILVPMGPGVPPGIMVPAEALGLATIRSGTAAVWPTPGGPMPFNDDLNALDVVVPEPNLVSALLAGLLMICSRKRTLV